MRAFVIAGSIRFAASVAEMEAIRIGYGFTPEQMWLWHQNWYGSDTIGRARQALALIRRLIAAGKLRVTMDNHANCVGYHVGRAMGLSEADTFYFMLGWKQFQRDDTHPLTRLFYSPETVALKNKDAIVAAIDRTLEVQL